MSTDVKASWVSARLPILAQAQVFFTERNLAREAPYLGMLPALITAALVFMAASGLVLSVYYNGGQGFSSLQFIDRDVSNGWLIHAFHETGATMIFGAVYLGLLRSLWLRNYKAPGELVWFLSLAKFLLLLLIGYLGYVLADGAVSYWSLSSSIAGAFSLSGVPGGIPFHVPQCPPMAKWGLSRCSA